MKKKLLLTVAVLVALLTVSFVAQQVTAKKYKCLIQLTNYKGEGAYIVASLINPQGKYEQTLQVLGDDPEWYDDHTEWSKFDKGYKIRFETAVEDDYYYAKDAEIELKKENLNTKVEGKGYIRYVRLMPN